jgi:hypothetical protein
MERKRTPVGFVHWAAVVLLMALVLPASLSAQETRGRITGRVVDTSNATVPGATVTVTDLARGTKATATTNEQGLFQVNYLLPGTYRVEVELAGFKKWIQENVQIQMLQTLDLAVVLEVGTVQESVSVTAEAPVLNTTDANLGLVVDQVRLASLPLIHGDPYKIMGLAEGVAHINSQRLDRPYEPTHIIGYAYDGTRSNRSDLLIDGSPSTATANANEVIATYVPLSDLVQEFKVQTATFDAQFGNTEGGVTSISIKSGTNKFHGTGYYFVEPWQLMKKDFFGTLRGDAMPHFMLRRPGFTVGGPVFKDRTFFMFGFEHMYDRRTRYDGGTAWVPTDALKRGDFSAYSANITIYDPATRVPTGGGQYGNASAFYGNIIPDYRISPISKKILDLYGSPKHSGLDGNVFDSTLPEIAHYNNLTGRVDQQFATNNRMFARFSWYNRLSDYNDYTGTGISATLFQFRSWQFVADDVHVFNPTTVLDVRYGYNRFDRNSGSLMKYRNFDLTTLGFPSRYNDLIPEINRYFPRLAFTGSPGTVGTQGGADYRPVTSHTVTAVLNKSLRTHSLKGGMEVRQYGERSRSTGTNQSGYYTFNNSYTRPSSASSSDYAGLQAYAAFLLGLPSTSQLARTAAYDEYSRTWGFFAQDDWRVTSKLTLNLGLRYEVETALTERDNKSITDFDTEYVQPMQAQVQASYAALPDSTPNPQTGQTLKQIVPQISVKGGVKFAGVDGSNRLYKTPKNTLLPRFGFAYQLTPKTVIRGGAGLFAGFLGERRGDVLTYGYSQTTTAGTTVNANGAPIPQDWATVWIDTPIVEPTGSSLGRQTYLGQSITFFNQDPRVSKQLRYQIGIQRELAAGFAFDASFVGNYGYDIEINRNINAVPSQFLSTDNARTTAMSSNNSWLTANVTPNPFAGLLPGSGLSTTITRAQLLRPYPAFGDITTTNNDGKSWYKSAQFGLQKRFSKGYTLGVAYTLSRWWQATEYLNATDEKPTKMIGDQDVTHRVSISTVVGLPFGNGRRFLSESTGIVNGLVGGWQLQAVYSYQTGLPIPFGDLFYNGTDPVNGTDIAIPGGDLSIDRWFNTGVFTSVLDGTSGTNSTPVNHLRTLKTRFSAVRRDCINNLDFSLLKTTRFHSGVELQLRAEFINILNNPYLPNPQLSVTSTSFGTVTASNQDNWATRAQLGAKILF